MTATKRKPVKKSASVKEFSKKARKTAKANVQVGPMRGGIRL